ncbi:MAG: endonuclease III [Candidatus Anstonellales archaeon]
MDKKKTAIKILKILKRRYPNARTSLIYKNPFQLLIATVLSAQCTDKQVNKITPALFAKYPSAFAFASANEFELRSLIRSTGFYKTKAHNIIGACKKLVLEHDGNVPLRMSSLLTLPGVGRKTANIVLGNYGIVEGVAVDTHVKRISNLIGWTKSRNPKIIESDLMSLFPKKEWPNLNPLLIAHGRKVCVARNPKCGICPISKFCPSSKILPNFSTNQKTRRGNNRTNEVSK